MNSAPANLIKPAPWLEGLNPAQREAVEALEEPLLVLAGAGTGKTKTLTARLAHIIGQELAAPENILAVTFTNKAAGEMGERAASMLRDAGIRAYLPWLGTFHAIGAKMLRRHADLVGLESDFRILTAPDSRQLIRQILPRNQESAKQAAIHAHRIAAWKEKGLLPDDIDAHANGGGEDDFERSTRLLFRRYETALREINAADFGDLILKPLRIFQMHEDVLALWQKRFHYLLVDEYQDTNLVQYRWLRALCGERRTICCVGDDDQSIYGWRGARLENILHFQRDFPGARVVKLEQNYRSRKNIITAAAGLISGNRSRLGKNLWTEAEQGQRLRVIKARDEWDEARQLAAYALAENKRDVGWGEMAVLVRTARQMRVIRNVLIEYDVPHLMVRGTDFYELSEIRDLAAYLSLLVSDGDDLAFMRAIAAPPRGVGAQSLTALRALAQTRGISLAAAAALDEEVLRANKLARGAKTLHAFVKNLTHWRTLSGNLALPNLTWRILEESGYLAKLQEMQDKGGTDEIDGARRRTNLEDLRGIMERKGFESIGAFLEHAALQGEESEETQDKVKLMTIHAAKGLEFRNVFLPGWEEDILPHIRALEAGGNEVEEERRLAHVALTRAREQIWISYAAQRNQNSYRRPSRFLNEIPAEMLEHPEAPKRPRKHFNTKSNYDDDHAPIHEIRFDETEISPFPSEEEPTGAFREPSPKKTYPAFRAPSPKRKKRTKLMTNWKKGEKIVHGDYGEGVIVSVSGRKLTINFNNEGTKTVMGDYVARMK